MNDLPSVWLVIGVQGAGKTTVAELLARRFAGSAGAQPADSWIIGARSGA